MRLFLVCQNWKILYYSSPSCGEIFWLVWSSNLYFIIIIFTKIVKY